MRNIYALIIPVIDKESYIVFELKSFLSIYNTNIKLSDSDNFSKCYFLPFVECSCFNHSEKPQCLLQLTSKFGLTLSNSFGYSYISNRIIDNSDSYLFHSILFHPIDIDKINLFGIDYLYYPQQTENVKLFGPEVFLSLSFPLPHNNINCSDINAEVMSGCLPLKQHATLSFQQLIDELNGNSRFVGLFESNTLQIQNAIYRTFMFASYPCCQMSYLNFHRYFRDELMIEEDEIPHYFRSFKSNKENFIDFQQFLVGLACMDSSTLHGGQSGELRSRYIFRFYDQDADGFLTIDDIKQIILDIHRKRQKIIMSVEALNKHLLEALSVFNLTESIKTINEEKFLFVIGNLKFRGTSILFRMSESVSFSNRIINSSNYGVSSDGNRKSKSLLKMPKGSFESYNGQEDVTSKNSSTTNGTMAVCRNNLMNSESNKYVLAVHSVKVHKEGTVVSVKPIWDDIRNPKQLGEFGCRINISYDRLQSINSFNQNSFPNEILQALNYFRYPDNKNNKYSLSWGDVNMDFLGQYINLLCDDVLTIVGKEARMLEISSPTHVLGDLHGNYVDLIEFEEVFWRLGVNLAAGNFLFLGDYVDRGEYGVEVITYLFSQKLLNPEQIYLLRGNHEIRSIQENYSFYNECITKFGCQLGTSVWESINSVFDALPLAAVIDSRLFCVHGGIPRPSLLSTNESHYYHSTALTTDAALAHLREKINESIPCPLVEPESECSLAWEIMWSDPLRRESVSEDSPDNVVAGFKFDGDIDGEQGNNLVDIDEGFSKNTRRSTACFFNEVALANFLDRHGFSHVIRAHEVQQIGFNIEHQARLITVFSSSHYCNKTNEAACLFVNNNKLRLLRLAS